MLRSERTWIARVIEMVAISISGGRSQRTFVTSIALVVVVDVALIGVGGPRTVVLLILDAVAILVGARMLGLVEPEHGRASGDHQHSRDDEQPHHPSLLNLGVGMARNLVGYRLEYTR